MKKYMLWVALLQAMNVMSVAVGFVSWQCDKSNDTPMNNCMRRTSDGWGVLVHLHHLLALGEQVGND